MNRYLKNRGGFTLIELMIVVAIIAIIAAVAIPTYLSFVDRAKVVSGVSTMERITIELEAYVNDKGNYPATIDFTNFTDQDGDPVLRVLSWDEIKGKFFSWDSYTPESYGYTIVAKANDSSRTVITATPTGITY